MIKFMFRFIIRCASRGFKSGTHITRYYMYQHIDALTKSIPNISTCNKILSISGSEHLIGLLNVKNPEIIKADFPKYNMLCLPFENDQFDWVVSDQVLEHIEGDPQQAINESRRVLKPGGIAVHTTCFINPIHRDPGDFWRFTPEALQLLCKNFSKTIDVGGWGNPYVWLLVWVSLRFEPIPDAQWHPLHKLAMVNKKDCPIATWIIVQK